MFATARGAQIQIRRTHPHSDPRRRARRRRSVPRTAEPPARLNMDNRIQVAHYCALYDTRGRAERHPALSVQLAAAQASYQQLYRGYVQLFGYSFVEWFGSRGSWRIGSIDRGFTRLGLQV